VPQGWELRSDALQLAQEVWRADAVRNETTEAARGGEL
jgi:hypothetical protein